MWNLAATALLAPMLLVQGRYVRRTVPRLPEADGPRSGVAGRGRRLRLLLIGDSSAAGVGASTQSEALSGSLVEALARDFELHWRVCARTGMTAAEAVGELERGPAEPVDVAISVLGVNDVTGASSLAHWRAAQARLLDRLHDKYSARLVVASGLPPMHRFPALPQPLRWYLGARARRLDEALVALVAQRSFCELAPLSFGLEPDLMARDGFHPSPRAYALWGASLAQRIRRRWPGHDCPGESL